MIALAIAGVVPLALHAEGKGIPRPSPGLAPNPGIGRTLYEKSCAQRHGVDLRGTPRGPPPVHRVYAPSHHADIAFQLAAKYGSRQHRWNFGDMQPVNRVTPDEVAHITAYVRDRQRQAGIP